jgi:general nucleoside transport system permease protein
MNWLDIVIAILVSTQRAATPLMFAAIGELVVEKAGVLNLGVEGMMLGGAVVGFIAAVSTGSATVGILAAMLAGAALAALFALLTLGLLANQVATGLALTIFGTGFSALVGRSFSGTPFPGLRAIDLPILSHIPVVGPLFFQHDPLVYAAVALVFVTHYFIYHTRVGLLLRSVGESPDAAHALGYRVVRLRFLALLFGGAMAGLGGAYLSLVYTPMWSENMTAGRGWIALALVVFATWKPIRVLIGAYIFGGVTILQLNIQGAGFSFPSQLLSTLPYLATVLVLVLISHDAKRIKLDAPAALGKAFRPTS